MKGRSLLWAGYLLCLAGLYASWMLSYSYVLGLQLPCGETNGCLTVALSPAARIAGVPLPVYGLVFYAALAALTLQTLRLPGWRGAQFLFWISLAGALAATGLTAYSITALRAECPWCIASNLTACLLALVSGFDHGDLEPARQGLRGIVLPLAIASLVGVAMGVSTKLAFAQAQRFPGNPAALASASVSEMAPSDSVILHGHEPTVVMFVDLECPACKQSLRTVSNLAQGRGLQLLVRHLPHGIHPHSRALAVLCEEAQQQGRGLQFVEGVFRDDIDSIGKARDLMRSLKLQDSPALRQVARQRIQRDRALSKRLGLTQTPSIFLLRSGGRPEPVTADSLPVLISDPS